MNTSMLHSTIFSKENLLLYAMILFSMIVVFFPINYGLFYDELYSIALSKNLAFGFVDVPPLMPLVLAIIRKIFGESIYAIHVLPAITTIIALVITSHLVRKMGGGLFAQSCSLIMVATYGQTAITNYDCMAHICWGLAIYSLVMLLLTENKKYLLYFGAAIGFGLLSKLDILWFLSALAIALPFTPQRKYFWCKEFWLAGLIALLIALPFLIWIIQHDFITLEFLRAYSHGASGSHPGFLEFLKDQIISWGIAGVLVLLASFYYYFCDHVGKKFKLLGITYIALFALCLVTGAKFYLITAFNLAMLFGGVLFIETKCKTIPQTIFLITVTIFGIIYLPYYRPILPVAIAEKYIGFLAKAHMTIKYQDSSKVLPQWLYDRFGAEETAAEVARVYYSLSASERTNTVILAKHYPTASAIYYYAAKYKLPRPISGSNAYYLWGPRNITLGSNVIAVGYDEEEARQQKEFKNITVVGQIYNKYNSSSFNKLIYFAKALVMPVNDFWLRQKRFS